MLTILLIVMMFIWIIVFSIEPAGKVINYLKGKQLKRQFAMPRSGKNILAHKRMALLPVPVRNTPLLSGYAARKPQ